MTGPGTNRNSAKPGGSAKGTRRRTVVRRAGIGLIALAVAGGGTWIGIQAMAAQKEADRYTTTTVGTGSVTQTLSAGGTIAKVNQATASFPASGTITSVKVAVGDSVEAGQTLATMDTTDLEAAVIQAKADLASAEEDLANAEDAASASASPSTSASASASAGAAKSASTARSSGSAGSSRSAGSSAQPSSRTSSGSPSSGSPTRPEPGTSDSARLLKAVQGAQQELAKRQAAATAALTAQDAACSPLTGVTPTPTPSGSTTPSPSTRPSSSAGATPSASGTVQSATPTPSATTGSGTAKPVDYPVSTGDELQKCIDALTAAQTAQQAVTDEQAVLSTALTRLATALTQAGGNGSGSGGSGSGGSGSGGSGSGKTSGGSGGTSTRTGGSGSGGSGSGGSGSGGSGSGGSGSGGSGSSGSGSPGTGSTGGGGGQGGTTTVGTAEAAVTKAQLALTTAEDNLDAAALRSPLTGVVAELPFTKGATASTSDQAVVIGKGSTQVDLQVSEATFRQLKVGQKAQINQAGQAPVAGTVSAKALLPSSSASGSSTFGVTVTAPASTSTTLRAGATASVTVTIASVDHAVVVPVSAITRESTTGGTVSVLANGVATTTRVSLGVVGDTTAQITEGVRAGAVVILADRTAAVPSNSTNSVRQFAGGGGGFGGAPPGGVPAGGVGGAGRGTGPR